MDQSVHIEISVRRERDGSYSASLRLWTPESQGGQELVAGAPAPLEGATLQALSLDPDRYGGQLAAMVFAAPEMRRAWELARAFATGQGRVCKVHLALDTGDSFLHSLRWETLHDPERRLPIALSERTIFSRTLPSYDLPASDRASTPRRQALVVIASPLDLDTYRLTPINVPSEVARVRKTLRQIPLTLLGLQTGPGAPPASLSEIVARLSSGYALLYLVCHGRQADGEPYLMLEQPDGSCAREPVRELVSRISALRHLPLLVVLATCQSAGESHSEAVLTAPGPQLAQAGVQAVLAMQGAVSMATVRELIPRFFQALLETGQADEALATARLALHHGEEWWKPVLFLRAGDGRPWAKEAQPLAGRPRLIAAGAAALALIVTLVVFLVWPQAPPVMTGGINVAVLPLAGDPLQPGPSAEQRSAYTQQIVEFMRASLGGGLEETGGLRFQVWGPRELGRAALDRVSLDELARRINATMIVYGSVGEDERGQGELSVQLYVAGVETADMWELLGAYYVGEPVPYVAPLATGSPDDRTGQRVQTRIETITALILGLRELSDPSGAFNAALAEQFFAQAQGRMRQDSVVQTPPSRCPRGFVPRSPAAVVPNPRAEATVQVLMGNVALRARDYQLALDRFVEARILDCAYGRAHLGVALALTDQTVSGYEEAGLAADPAARAAYRAALGQAEEAFVWAEQADHPERVFFDERLAAGRGRLQLGLARLPEEAVSALAAARSEFSIVIDAYETARPDERERRFLRAMAASAYAARGLAAGIANASDEALRDYRRAVVIEEQLGGYVDPNRIAIWQTTIARLEFQIEDCASALRSVQIALDHAQDPTLVAAAEQLRAEIQGQCP